MVNKKPNTALKVIASFSFFTALKGAQNGRKKCIGRNSLLQ